MRCTARAMTFSGLAQRWPKLSIELKQIIVKIVKRSVSVEIAKYFNQETLKLMFSIEHRLSVLDGF